VNKYTVVYMYKCVRGGGIRVLGLRQKNKCRKVPLQKFFYMTTFCIAFYESYLSTCVRNIRYDS